MGVSLGVVVIALIMTLLLKNHFDAPQERAPTQSAPDTNAFITAAQEYDSMISAHKATSILALENACEEHMPDPTYYYTDMVEKYAPTWIHLATKMIDALRVMAHIQKSLPQDVSQEIRKFETLHALSLVRDKIPGVNCYHFKKNDTSVNRSDDDNDDNDNCADLTPHPLNPQALLKNFSQSLEIIYPPLINSFKQGLPLESYLRTLSHQENLSVSGDEIDKHLESMRANATSSTQPLSSSPMHESFKFLLGLYPHTPLIFDPIRL
ncbi:hypothetical protein HAL07_13290 [Helicobacter ailurogastricus]|uniref:Uncharacterized protein n=2 Tax=Helicobacter ailurogastricus TaxID=1578720 RepID=A0A0K2Y4T7_9HELI|nr:hypothetical protein ASB7_01690 [Helicobacter ailurogastricus]CRF52864.1 hypothetical protein HAL07_13290 [Helicobacter ailurogastricus]